MEKHLEEYQKKRYTIFHQHISQILKESFDILFRDEPKETKPDPSDPEALKLFASLKNANKH